MLITAETVAGDRPPGAEPGMSAEWAVRALGGWVAPTPIEIALRADLGPDEIAVAAFANEGRWVVGCPDCAGAQFASRADHRFMCVECANVAVDGLWRPVTWPDDVGGIETELIRRPAARNRNWLPGETVEDLAAEYEAATADPPDPELQPTELPATELPVPPDDEEVV